MTIYRTIDGVERAIELTDHELFVAYNEKRAEYERDDVLSYLDCEEEFLARKVECEITHEQLMSLVPEITARYRKYRDDNSEWWDDAQEAALNVLRDYEVDRGFTQQKGN